MISMNILLIESYYGGSHRAWADSFKKHSSHHVELLTLPAQFWKWRMQGGAVTLARLYEQLDTSPDVILASDMMNVASFKALIDKSPPIALYFHENQLTYPLNARQRHGWQYGFTNYISVMVADQVFFNSPYHLRVFYEALPRMLKHFGDYNELETIPGLKAKSSVLPIGLELDRLQQYRPETLGSNDGPLIVWNHRWEDDKNPELFARTMLQLTNDRTPFQLAILGENVQPKRNPFEELRSTIPEHIVQFGYVESFAAYARLLWQADYVVSTSYQEFFGGAIAEAIYCGCVPILPHRLNYPHLLPEHAHDACLYPSDLLYRQLKKHLQGAYTIDMKSLQTHIAQYDWSQIAPTYDQHLAQLKEGAS